MIPRSYKRSENSPEKLETNSKEYHQHQVLAIQDKLFLRHLQVANMEVSAAKILTSLGINQANSMLPMILILKHKVFLQLPRQRPRRVKLLMLNLKSRPAIRKRRRRMNQSLNQMMTTMKIVTLMKALPLSQKKTLRKRRLQLKRRLEVLLRLLKQKDISMVLSQHQLSNKINRHHNQSPLPI